MLLGMGGKVQERIILSPILEGTNWTDVTIAIAAVLTAAATLYGVVWGARKAYRSRKRR